MMTRLCEDLADVDAEIVHDALHGLGTNDEKIIEILCTRTPYEISRIKTAYERLFPGKTIGTSVRSKWGHHNLHKVFQALLVNPRNQMPPEGSLESDVKTLYAAGEAKWFGTDQDKFIEILTTRPRAYIHRLSDVYLKDHGKALHVLLQKELGGDLKKALEALVTPLDEYYTEKFHEAMKGLGTNDDELIRTVVTQRGPGMGFIAKRFADTHGKSLQSWVDGDTSGDYEKAILAVINAWPSMIQQ